MVYLFFHISAVMVKHDDQNQSMEERIHLGLWLQRDTTLLWKGGSRIMSATADIMGRWEIISSNTNKSRESNLEVGQAYKLPKPSPHWWILFSIRLHLLPAFQTVSPAGHQLFKYLCLLGNRLCLNHHST